MSKQFHLSIPISKIDEEQRIVTGVATSEALDSQGDIMDYKASKKAFSQWIGNIREMHNPVSIGKAIDVQFDDAKKEVILSAYISKSPDGENAWTKVKEGILTGFSIGGRIFEVAKDKAVEGANRILDYSLSETSLVDNPANPEAKLLMVKSVDGALQHVEESKVYQPIYKTWWHDAFMPSIEKAEKLYNKDMKKSVYGADFLVDLACNLNYWIESEKSNGEDVGELVNALGIIKQAAIGELQEAPDAQDEQQDMLASAVELASKAIDLRKEKSMSNQEIAKAGAFVEGEEPRDDTAAVVTKVTASPNAKKAGTIAAAPIKKSSAVSAGEERDENAEVVTTAEENGRPVNDTEERAQEAGVAPAVEGVEPIKVTDAPVAEAEAEAKEEAEEVVEVKVEDKSEDAPKTDKTEGDSEKAASVADLAKSVDALLAKFDGQSSSELKKLSDAVSAVADKVEKSVASLEGRIAELEKQPLPVAAKASYIEVAKGDESEPEIDVPALLKKRDEAAANPGSISPAEVAKLFTDLRKAQKAGLL